ncbi:MAG: peptidylprolyl isomerase [Candidatus Paracaedibacteraceae bacterium]|nr:peptidylprolyl isomerase [Candidatus Paracaedibacteraceae bacterium]
MTKISFLKTALMLSIGIMVTNTAVLAGEAPGNAPASTASKPGDMNRIVAKFADGSVIKFQEIQDLMAQLPPKLRDAPFSKLYAGLLNRLVDSKVLLDAAFKGGFDKDPEALKRIADAKELLLQKAFLDQEIEKLITDSILRAKYAELLKLLPKDEMEADVSHILFDSKEDAEKALKELSSAGRNLEKKFNDMVLAKSKDTSTKENKGSIGWVRKADIKNETLFTSEKGTLVPQVLKVFDQGYSVFYVKDKRPIQPPEFEAIKSSIKQAVTPQYAVQVVDKMRRDSGLKLTGLDGQPLPLPDLPPMPDPTGKEPEKKPADRKDFSGVNEKALDNSMVVGVFANGDKITLGQVRDSLDSIPEQLKNAPFHQLFEPLVLRVADTKLLIEAAKKAGLEKSADLLKKQEEVEKGMFQRAYLDKQFAQIITPEMLKEAYQEFLRIFPKDDMEVRIKHIMVATKDEATSLIKEIKNGKVKFNDELVKAKSIDPQTKETGGDLGYIPKKQLPADLGDVLFKAAKATLIPEPIALGENGFSIIRVEDKRAVQPPSIEEIRPQLTQAVSQREAAKIVMKLREDAKVVLHDMDGNVMQLAPAPAATSAKK